MLFVYPVISLLVNFWFIPVIYILFYTRWWPALLFYLIWIYLDKDIGKKGGRSIELIRNSFLYKWVTHYFPVKCVKQTNFQLDESKNYLFVSVPHGCMGMGIGFCFANRCYGLFPGFDFHLTTLETAFYTPFYREYQWYHVIDCSEESINHVLASKKKIVGLIPGGAEESLYLEPNVYKTVIKKRKGFARIALKNGASLVPTITFGENDIFDQFRGTGLLKMQRYFKKVAGYVPILVKGRGFLQPSLIPFRKPLTMVGK